MMELRHLRYFVAVAEDLSFSRAAKRLRIAQPSLSVAIRQLEQAVGTNLLTRTSREVSLTDAGKAFLPGARRTLLEAEAAIASASRAAAGELGTMRIAYSWSARFETFPQLGRAFAERSPEVELLAEEMWNAQMGPALRSGDFDIASTICPDSVDDLADTPIRSERIVALLSSSHPLASGRSIRLEQLADDEFLLFPREFAPRLYDFHLALCRGAGFEPRQGGNSLHTQWTLQAWGERAGGLVPHSLSEFVPPEVVAKPLELAERLETPLLWRADDDRQTLAGFVDAARRWYADELHSTLT